MDFKSKKVSKIQRDPDFVVRENRGRVPYEQSRLTVSTRQNMQLTPMRTQFSFVSATSPARTNFLTNDNGVAKEFLGSKLKQPALDHIIQYAAIDHVYQSRVIAERQKSKARISSPDLFQALHGAGADPDNLRVVTADEHRRAGGHKRVADFTTSDIARASKLFNKHLPAIGSTDAEIAAFHNHRPKLAVPANQTVSTYNKPQRQPRRNYHEMDSDSE